MITSMKEVSTSTTTDEHSPLMISSVLEIGARSQSVSQSVSLLAASDQTDRGRSKSFPTTTSRAVITMIMDEESPWRCRRTDGKKWRCKRNVVPDHKYCDRHINRGRLRSRKPVEQQQQEQHQQPLPHFHPADHPQTKNDGGGGGGGGCSKVSVRVGGVAVSSTTAAPSLATTAADHSRVDVSHHFSPKSVLPGKTAKGSCIYGGEEEELRRCRRTDGKKWRCRREVVYNQKYCDRHLHRGAKRRPEVAATSGGIPPFLHCSNLLPRKASCILTQAAVAQDDDNVCNSNTSSDATVSEGRLYY